jgi:hypothetical protein
LYEERHSRRATEIASWSRARSYQHDGRCGPRNIRTQWHLESWFHVWRARFTMDRSYKILHFAHSSCSRSQQSYQTELVNGVPKCFDLITPDGGVYRLCTLLVHYVALYFNCGGLIRPQQHGNSCCCNDGSSGGALKNSGSEVHPSHGNGTVAHDIFRNGCRCALP